MPVIIHTRSFNDKKTNAPHSLTTAGAWRNTH